MLRILRLIRFLAPSAATFLTGTGAFFLVDVWIGRMETPDNIADWALFKSLVFPLSTLVLLGIDQAVVREPSKFPLYARKAVLAMTVLAGVAALLSWAAGAYHNALYIFAGTLLLSVSTLYFGIFRANLLFNLAHVARDGWKPLLLLMIVVAHFHADFDAPLLLIAACGLTTIICVWAWSRRSVTDIVERHDDISDFRSALSVSWPFCLAAFSLAIASYGEVLLLKIFSAEAEISGYFRAIVLFSYPAMILNTYLVTFLGSFIRQRAGDSARYFAKLGIYLVPLMVLVPGGAILAGYSLQRIVFPGHETPLFLAALLSGTAGVRFGYTIITSFVGALGSKREIRVVSLLYFLLALLTPAICLPIYLVSENILFAVAATAMLHWLLRGLIGLRLTMRLARHALSEA